MALEDYDLTALSSRIAREFRCDEADSALMTIVKEKVNDAQTWIVRRRPNWPWMKKHGVFDTVVAGVGTADFLKGSNTLLNVASVTPVKRQYITTESSGTKPSTGHLVTAFSAGTATIHGQFLGTTLVADVIRTVTGMFQLPDDFLRMDGPPLIMGAYPTSTELRYQDPELFQRNQYRQTPALLNNIRYTVTRDPLDEEERKYMLIYPYISDIRVIRYQYHRDCPELVDDADIPIIPRSDRTVLMNVAMWFFGQRQDEQDVQIYMQQAMEGLERMTQEFEMVDDASEFVANDFEPDFVLPPPGYEDFNRG